MSHYLLVQMANSWWSLDTVKLEFTDKVFIIIIIIIIIAITITIISISIRIIFF